MPGISPDPHGLLCEQCGYPLDGFSHEAPCPECAKPVRESLPARRVGTAWQRGPAARALVRTAWQTLRHPMGTFRVLRVSWDRPTRLLLWVYILLATVVPLGAWAAMSIGEGGQVHLWYMRTTGVGTGVAAATDAFSFPRSALGIAGSACGVAIGVLSLTTIETLGVRFFGRRRQWRVTKPIAWSVCSHAAIGWVIGGVLHAFSPLAVIAARPLFDLLPAASSVQWATEAARWIPIGAFFIGMLVFETLVYVGVRECRYANASPPTTAPATRQAV